MPKYIVQNTNILRNGKTYPEGDPIELTEQEAAAINPLYLKPAPAQEENPPVMLPVIKGPVSAMNDRKKPLVQVKDPYEEKSAVPNNGGPPVMATKANKPAVPVPKGPVTVTELNAVKAPTAAKKGK